MSCQKQSMGGVLGKSLLEFLKIHRETPHQNPNFFLIMLQPFMPLGLQLFQKDTWALVFIFEFGEIFQGIFFQNTSSLVQVAEFQLAFVIRSIDWKVFVKSKFLKISFEEVIIRNKVGGCQPAILLKKLFHVLFHVLCFQFFLGASQ